MARRVPTRSGTAGLGLIKHGNPQILFTGRNAEAADVPIHAVKADGAAAHHPVPYDRPS